MILKMVPRKRMGRMQYIDPLFGNTNCFGTKPMIRLADPLPRDSSTQAAWTVWLTDIF
jgi:hypothetical protein